MAEDAESPLGGPLELPGGESNTGHSPHKSSMPRYFSKKIVVIVAIVLIIGGLGYAGLKSTSKDNQSGNKSSTSKNGSDKSNIVNDIASISTTKKFESGILGLELKYPDNWTVTETTDNGLRVESPEFSYQTIDKGKVTGYFRIYIRKGARASDGKYIGRGVAIQPSEKIVYSQPTSSQRKETNMTLFGLDTTDHFAYLLLAGNFELNKGETLGPNYGKETEAYIVGGGYSTKTLTDDLATNKVPMDGLTQKNSYKQAVEIIKSLKFQ